MDHFKDEVYENMDDISKMIEPFEFQLNNELSVFPDEIELTSKDMESIIVYSSGWSEGFHESLDTLIKNQASKLNLETLRKEIASNRSAHSMFEIIVDLDEEGCRLSYDFERRLIIGGKIFIRKKIVALEDSAIEVKMVNHIYYKFNEYFTSANTVNKKRLNEIAEMFGAKKAREERAWNKKVNALRTHFSAMITDKKLPIKDFELFTRFIIWNINYIKDGSLPAMANVAKMKIMLRNGLPIYSMKEEPV